ncbi:MAG: flavodoxin domain-containing protein [Candidatus Saccharibacteria bacterium]
MDRLNFSFGRKATKTPDLTEKPLSGTAIIFMSKHGTTQKVALLIKQLLMDENITLVDLDKQEKVDLTWCERVIIGGSIHMGQIQKPVQSFCQQYAATLKSKKLGLFLCCMYEGEKAIEQFNNAFPEDILAAAHSKALLGYELNFERMNIIERAITKKITGHTESMSHINQQELNRFIEELRSLVPSSANCQIV